MNTVSTIIDDATGRPTPAVPSALLDAYSSHRPAKRLDLMLDANEGAPPEMELTDMAGTLSAEALRRYPSAADLESSLARELGVDASRLLVTAGADDALHRCCALMLDASRNAVLTTPTFEMLRRYAMLQRAALRETRWMDGVFPIDAMMSRIDDATGVVAAVSPNNPTGGVVSKEDLTRLSAAARQALLIVDLAYTEFADEDLTAEAIALPNTVVVRTFSKAMGLAGLRVGYAIASEPVINWLRAVGNPYPVSSLSIAIALRGMSLGQREAFIAQAIRERTELTDLLTRLRCDPIPSQANFVLARFDRADAVRAALGDDGIAVRGFPGHEVLSSHLRITCPGNSNAFGRLCAAIERAVTKASKGARS